jgi:biotin carboxyl carrier protein
MPRTTRSTSKSSPAQTARPRTPARGKAKPKAATRTAPAATPATHPSSAAHPLSVLRLRITVEGKRYDVDVEYVGAHEPWAGADPLALAAASRVEGAPVGAKAARPGPRFNGRGATATAAPATAHATSPAASPVTSPEPRVPHVRKPAWHGVGAGKPGEVVAPVPCVVVAYHAKVGDTVGVDDPIATIEVSHGYSTGERPMVGVLRAPDAGVVREILADLNTPIAPAFTIARIG